MKWITENWLTAATILFIGGMTLYGHYRGFIRQAVSMVALVAAILAANIFVPQISKSLAENQAVHQFVEKGFTKALGLDQQEEEEPSAQREFIENLNLPSNLKETLIENNNTEVYELLGVNRFADYIKEYLSNTIIRAVVYVVLFIIVFIAIHLIMRWMDLIAKLPILSGVNQIAGAVLGGAEALLLIWVGCLILTIFAGTEGGMAIFQQIEGSKWLSFLYGHNFLVQVAMGLLHGSV